MHVWVIVLATFTGCLYQFKAQTQNDYAYGRTYYLNPVLLTWEEAEASCRDMNGSLATIYSLATIADLDISGDWTFWIGLRQVVKDNWTWTNGEEKDFSNWNFGQQEVDEPVTSCVVSVTRYPNWWLPLNCSEKMPSLCEVQTGECDYKVFKETSLVAFNSGFVKIMSLADCYNACNDETKFVCRSFEYNPTLRYCQLSADNHVLQPQAFYTNHKEWDYYHRTCNNGGLLNIASLSPIGILITTPVTSSTSITLPSSSLPVSSSDVIESSMSSSITTAWESKLTICTEIDLTSQPPNDTVPEEVKELQEMQTVFKERQSTLKKTSVVDPRPSSTYIGSTAVIIAFSIIGLIVIADLLTFPKHFRHAQRHAYIQSRRKSRREKEKNLAKQLKRSNANGDVASTVISPEVSGVLAARKRLFSSLDSGDKDDVSIEHHAHAHNPEDSGIGMWQDTETPIADEDNLSDDLPLEKGANSSAVVEQSDDIKLNDNWTIRKQKMLGKRDKPLEFIYDGNGLISTQL